jgi:ATP-dependent Clp protease protease subunit
MAEIKSTMDTQEKNSLVNIISRGYNDIYINIDDDIESPKTYRDVYDTLLKSTIDDRIFVVLNTCGGRIASMNQIVNTLLETDSCTTAIIHEASSAGAGIALACDKIEVKKFGYMMIHNMSSGAFGKLNEIDIRIEHVKKWNKEISNELYRGFLTDVELQQMLEGKDFYFNKEEIEKRLLNWVPMRKR